MSLNPRSKYQQNCGVKRGLVFITAGSLLFGITVATAANPPKPGTLCAKLGDTKTLGNLKYTCIKSGKKLVWSKGSKVKLASQAQPSSQPVAKPSNSPTPTPSISPNSPESNPTNPQPSPQPSPAETSKLNQFCFTLGEEIESLGEKLVCRQIAGNQRKYFLINNPLIPVNNPVSPNGLASCRLPDRRPLPLEPEGTRITYPLTPHFGSVKQGVQKIAVVGFDFEDAPGSGSPLDMFGSAMETSNKFFDWYSNGKVKFQFLTYDKWIRISGKAASYNTDEHFQSSNGLTVEQMAREFYLKTSKHLDLAGISAIWFVYPKDIKQLTYNFGSAGGNYGLPAIYGLGPYRYNSYHPVWTYFIHEMLHEQGLQGHSPKAPWVLGVMITENGISGQLNSWDELTLDWLLESEIYCTTKENLSSVTLELAPIEREQSGLHTAMIRLGDHQALVVESHRRGTFSQGMPDGLYGVTVQLVDTSKVTTWNDEQATSVYIKISNSHGRYPAYGIPLINGRDENSGVAVWNGLGISQAAFGPDMNYFLLEGESIEVQGVKIDFIRSGYTDQVTISVNK